MEFFLIYLYIVVINLTGPMTAFVILLLLTYFVAGVVYLVSLEETDEVARTFQGICNRHWKKPLWVAFSLILFIAAIPDKKEMAWIVGGGVTWKIAQNEEIQKLPDNTARAVNSFLESVYKDNPIEARAPTAGDE